MKKRIAKKILNDQKGLDYSNEQYQTAFNSDFRRFKRRFKQYFKKKLVFSL